MHGAMINVIPESNRLKKNYPNVNIGKSGKEGLGLNIAYTGKTALSHWHHRLTLARREFGMWSVKTGFTVRKLFAEVIAEFLACLALLAMLAFLLACWSA